MKVWGEAPQPRRSRRTTDRPGRCPRPPSPASGAPSTRARSSRIPTPPIPAATAAVAVARTARRPGPVPRAGRDLAEPARPGQADRRPGPGRDRARDRRPAQPECPDRLEGADRPDHRCRPALRPRPQRTRSDEPAAGRLRPPLDRLERLRSRPAVGLPGRMVGPARRSTPARTPSPSTGGRARRTATASDPGSYARWLLEPIAQVQTLELLAELGETAEPEGRGRGADPARPAAPRSRPRLRSTSPPTIPGATCSPCGSSPSAPHTLNDLWFLATAIAYRYATMARRVAGPVIGTGPVRGRAARLGQRRPGHRPVAAPDLPVARPRARRPRGRQDPQGRRLGRPRPADRHPDDPRRSRPARQPRPRLRPASHDRLVRQCPGARGLVAGARSRGALADRRGRRLARAGPSPVRRALPLAGCPQARP